MKYACMSFLNVDVFRRHNSECKFYACVLETVKERRQAKMHRTSDSEGINYFSRVCDYMMPF